MCDPCNGLHSERRCGCSRCVSPAQWQRSVLRPPEANLFPALPLATPPASSSNSTARWTVRESDEKNELAAMRARVRATTNAQAKGEKLVYISLPKLFAEVKALKAAGKEIPEELRFLHGMTQLRYVFVFPEQKDLVIAGPAEPWHLIHGEEDAVSYVVGTPTGHPVMQLDDMVVAFRTALEGRGNVFGCGIYPSPDSIKIADTIAHEMIRNTRAERMAAMQERLGPQEIRIFGTRNDTRFAYICVAADYELKRFALNLDRAPSPICPAPSTTPARRRINSGSRPITSRCLFPKTATHSRFAASAWKCNAAPSTSTPAAPPNRHKTSPPNSPNNFPYWPPRFPCTPSCKILPTRRCSGTCSGTMALPRKSAGTAGGFTTTRLSPSPKFPRQNSPRRWSPTPAAASPPEA